MWFTAQCSTSLEYREYESPLLRNDNYILFINLIPVSQEESLPGTLILGVY